MPKPLVIRTKFCKTCEKPLRSDAVFLYCRDHGKKIYNEVYHAKNKEKHNAASLKYRRENLEDVREYDIARSKLPERKSLHRDLEKRRLKEDENFRLAKYLRNTVYVAVKNNAKKSKKAEWILGCSVSEYRQYLESKFKEGMSWENYGQWHIDHIEPLFKFDLKKEEEFLRVGHFLNTQPLWKDENLKKRNTEMGYL